MTEFPHAADLDALPALLSAASKCSRKEPMARHTTLRVGGPADLYIEPGSEQDLAMVVRYCAEHGIPLIPIGRGSNLLVRDGGIRGVVLCLAQPAFSQIDVQPPLLTVGAGARLKAVAVEARKHGLAGMEFLEGIPGAIGGALRMNAGAMNACLFDVLHQIRFMDRDGAIHELPANRIHADYRHCAFFVDHLALGAVLRGRPESPDAIAERMQRYSRKRWDSQPAAPSAGCMFKNPAALPAGRLVEELGLKGTRVGDATVSELHGNFIVNQGQATAAQILQLMDLIRHRALVERGIPLEPEVQILGEPLHT